MLSGVGPRAHLEAYGIEVLVDLPGVGRGLHDHSGTPLGFQLNPSVRKGGVPVSTLPLAATRDAELQARFMAEWEAGTGPYTTTGHEVTLFLTSPWANESSGSGYHPVGSCQMGRGADDCVDLQLRVRGVRGVRVVDGSVMPRIPRGNTTLPTIMVAEKLSGRCAPPIHRTKLEAP